MGKTKHSNAPRVHTIGHTYGTCLPESGWLVSRARRNDSEHVRSLIIEYMRTEYPDVDLDVIREALNEYRFSWGWYRMNVVYEDCEGFSWMMGDGKSGRRGSFYGCFVDLDIRR